MDENLPSYNLSVVVRETGVNPDTLRAWERRYGLPAPQRTDSGHRLYSQREIETIKWLQARLDEELRIHHAVELWRRIEASGQDPLAPQATTRAVSVKAPAAVSGEALDELRSLWLSACLSFDEPGAERILTQAFARYPLATVCLEVLQKSLAEIGRLWYVGKASVQQEHFTSALAIRRLNTLIAATPPAIRPERILVGCPPGEEHVFAPLLITLLLRQRGWDVVYLGANVPLERMDATIQVTTPRLVVLSAAHLTAAANLAETASYLYSRNVVLTYSGPVFIRLPAIRERISGYYLGDNLEGATLMIERLIETGATPRAAEPLPLVYQQALNLFREMAPLLDAHAWSHLKQNGLQAPHITIANENLSSDIESALRLGYLDALDDELEWIKALLIQRHLPKELLNYYLRIYQQALQTYLGEGGAPIIEWMEKRLNAFSEVEKS